MRKNKAKSIVKSLDELPTFREIVDKLPLPKTPEPRDCGWKILESIKYEFNKFAKETKFHAAFIGVDPGVSGAAVAITPILHPCDTQKVDGLKLDFARDFKTIGGLVEMAQLMNITCRRFQTEVVLEEVHAMPKQGVASTFTFGRAYGRAEGHCDSNHISPSYYPPQNWMKIMRKMFYLDKNPGDWRPYASSIFPAYEEKFMGRKKDHNTAEAALVAVAHIMNKGTYAP